MNRSTLAATALVLSSALAALPLALAEGRTPPAGRGAAMPPIKIKIVSESGIAGDLSEAQACAMPGWKVIGGGAEVHADVAGGLLTASYPEGNCWRAQSKAHQVSDEQRVVAYAILLYDPKNEWDVAVEQATGETAAHPMAQVRVRDGYAMTCGGARVNWTGAGNLLTASFPATDTVWEARSKDHGASDPATITAYAIGIRARNGQAPKTFVQTSVSSVKPHPAKGETLPEEWTLSGGGARTNWHGAGNLLWASYPSDERSWRAAGKDHVDPSPASVSVFVIGIKP